jgi:DMSO/TMAO reductase YedYZ heme-binding membrane subunit
MALNSAVLSNSLSANITGTTSAFLYFSTLLPGINRDLKLTRKTLELIRLVGKYRTQIGLLSAFMGCLHAIEMLIFHGTRGNTSSGFACLSIFLILSVTSGRWMQINIGKTWKKIHFLTYLLPLILLWHICSKMDRTTIFTHINIALMVSLIFLSILRIGKQKLLKK